jgi:putative ribosome biogenesis GTPase RsgA
MRSRLRGKLMETAQTADIAAIGDQVELLVSENENLDHIGTIPHVHERQHVLSRSVENLWLAWWWIAGATTDYHRQCVSSIIRVCH